jgi:8-oxo-dGTP pyrophosphatase MutT (NUDIX family)
VSTFRKVGERELYRGHVITVALGEFEAPDGERLERDIVHHPGAVAVVPIDGDEVVLVRQYRAPIDGWLLELPAGKRDVHGEAPEITAQRELEEEVGLHAGSLELLARFHNSPGFSDELILVYLGTDLTPAPMARDGAEEEAMTIERVRLDDVPALIDSGELMDAKTIIGLLCVLSRER